MTQIIVTIDDNSPITLIKKAISLLKGVKKVVVHRSHDVDVHDTHDLNEIPADIRSLIGIAAHINPDSSPDDERLAHILGK